MPVKTRGSAAVEKAQRRLALLKSIDDNLNLGHGLTIEAYTQLIDDTRTAIESHNKLLSNLEASRKTIAEMDKALSQMSERMLNGVAFVYGKNSMEYSKAGGSNRRRGKQSIAPVSPVVGMSVTQPAQIAIANQPTNRNGKTPVV